MVRIRSKLGCVSVYEKYHKSSDNHVSDIETFMSLRAPMIREILRGSESFSSSLKQMYKATYLSCFGVVFFAITC